MFHYFIELSKFDKKYWDSYVEINKKFSEIVIGNIEKGDIVWIHDYQLLLCPKMIKDKRPDLFLIDFSISENNEISNTFVFTQYHTLIKSSETVGKASFYLNAVPNSGTLLNFEND